MVLEPLAWPVAWRLYARGQSQTPWGCLLPGNKYSRIKRIFSIAQIVWALMGELKRHGIPKRRLGTIVGRFRLATMIDRRFWKAGFCWNLCSRTSDCFLGKSPLEKKNIGRPLFSISLGAQPFYFQVHHAHGRIMLCCHQVDIIVKCIA